MDASLIGTPDHILDQLTAGGIVVFVLNLIKTQLLKIGLVEETISKISRWLAAFAAALATIGITFVFDKEAGILTISGLTWTGFGLFLWEIVKQYFVQKGIFTLNKFAKNGKATT